MVADLDDNIVFENIQNNDISLSLKGLTAFKQQAETAKHTLQREHRQLNRLGILTTALK